MADTLRAVVRLAIPAVGQSLLHTLVFLIDRAMLGRHSADALAAMQICGPVVWSAVTVLTAATVGGVALVGRAVGAGDGALATAATRAALGFAGVVGTVVAVFGLFGLSAILGLFPAAGPEVHDAAQAYLSIVLPGLPVFLISLTAASVLTAAGDSRTPFFVAATGNALNVMLNWLLIFGHAGMPRLGAQGAALGSLAAMGLQATVLLLVLMRRGGVLTWRGRGGERDALVRMLRVSLPSLFERIAQQTGFMAYVTMIGALGTAAMAANQALISIESVCFLSADGIGIAAAAVVAQRLGARRPQAATLAAKLALGLGLLLLGLCAVVFLLVPELLLHGFTEDDALVALGVPCLYVAAAAQPFMAAGVILGDALRGAGATRAAFGAVLVGALVVRLGATYYFAFMLDLGLLGVWLGSTADWLTRAGLLTYFFVRGRWQEAVV